MSEYSKWILAIFMAAFLIFGVGATYASPSNQVQTLTMGVGEVLDIDCLGKQIVIRPNSNTALRMSCVGEVSPTDTPTPYVTETPAEPTVVKTNTVPAATSTAQPVGGIPLCSSHYDNVWHELFSAQDNCHYNHTHNANPALADGVFGTVAASWGGQTLSYPWATSVLENTIKHAGYKFGIRLGLPCSQTNTYNGKPANCVTDGRVQYHMVSSLMDWLSRFHSHYTELKICKRSEPTQCGIIRTGGWADFGPIHVPYKKQIVPRAGGAVDFGNGMLMTFVADPAYFLSQSVNIEPYIAVPSAADLGYYRKNPPSNSRIEIWSMREGKTLQESEHPLARFLVGIADSFNVADPNNLNNLIWICPDATHNRCPYNGSKHSVQELSAYIPSAFDADGDGFADYQGYTDRNGKIVTGCFAPALDCVPLSIEHAPVGYADGRDAGDGRNSMQEFDSSPVGEHWIEFPN